MASPPSQRGVARSGHRADRRCLPRRCRPGAADGVGTQPHGGRRVAGRCRGEGVRGRRPGGANRGPSVGRTGVARRCRGGSGRGRCGCLRRIDLGPASPSGAPPTDRTERTAGRRRCRRRGRGRRGVRRGIRSGGGRHHHAVDAARRRGLSVRHRLRRTRRRLGRSHRGRDSRRSTGNPRPDPGAGHPGLRRPSPRIDCRQGGVRRSERWECRPRSTADRGPGAGVDGGARGWRRGVSSGAGPGSG